MQRFTFIWKERFGPLRDRPVIVLLSPGNTRLTLSLDTRNALSGLSHTPLAPQSTSCEAPQNVLMAFAWQSSQGCGYPCCLGYAPFPTTPSTQRSMIVLGYTTLWPGSFFSYDLYLETYPPYLQCLLPNCQVSSLPNDCEAYWTREFKGSGNLCRCCVN